MGRVHGDEWGHRRAITDHLIRWRIAWAGYALALCTLAASIASAGWLALVATAVPALGVLAAKPKAGTFPTIAELRVTREVVPENRLTRPLPVPNIPARLGALISLLSLLILVTRSGAALARQRRADQTPSS